MYTQIKVAKLVTSSNVVLPGLTGRLVRGRPSSTQLEDRLESRQSAL